MFGNNNNNNNNKNFNVSNINPNVYDEIILDTLNSHTLSVMNLLDKNNISLDDEKLIDSSNQNLLHLSVKTKNVMLTEFLLDKKLDKNKKNIFGETPIDIAFKDQNREMVEKLYGVDKLNFHIQANKRLESKFDELDRNYQKFLVINSNLTAENTVLKKRLDNEIKTNKRKTEECFAVENDYKRMKIERDNVIDDNKTLRVVINNLRNGSRK